MALNISPQLGNETSHGAEAQLSKGLVIPSEVEGSRGLTVKQSVASSDAKS